MTVGIVGLGLIGGSIGLALREPGRKIVGFDVDPTAVQTAKSRFCVDEGVEMNAVAQADVVFVAVPPKYIGSTLSALAEAKKSETVMTECTSVKADALEWAKASREQNFVIGHPMAGHERSGAAFASAWMFRGAKWILCPEKWTSKTAVAKVEELVVAMGATPVKMAAEQHDRHVARVSHLPHAIAGVLVQLGGSAAKDDLSGGSWRDLTRVAGVDPKLWTQIFMANRQELARAIGETETRLQELRTNLESGDGDAVYAFFEQARLAKEKTS